MSVSHDDLMEADVDAAICPQLYILKSAESRAGRAPTQRDIVLVLREQPMGFIIYHWPEAAHWSWSAMDRKFRELADQLIEWKTSMASLGDQ